MATIHDEVHLNEKQAFERESEKSSHVEIQKGLLFLLPHTHIPTLPFYVTLCL